MAVHIGNSTMIGGVTPICNTCGVSLCWDISEEEYIENKAFWDNWKCESCNPNAWGSLKKYRRNQDA